MLHPDQNVGGYRLVRPLGEGPFGIVWLAADANDTPVVLKILRPAFAQRPTGQAAFARLQTTVAVHRNLVHDNLARVFGTVVDPPTGSYAMLAEYVEGRLLSHVQLPPAALLGQEPQSLAVLLSWLESLADAMVWLHTQGVIHGNLKPSNVMLVRTADGHMTKVMDLSWSSIGLAAPAAGAPSYLAPEQVQGGAPSAASDQWSVAKMLSDILSPSGEPLTLGSLPAVLVLAVQRALHQDPAQRFSTMTEFAEAIRAIRVELERSDESAPDLLPPASQAAAAPLGASEPPGFVEEPDTVRRRNPVAGVEPNILNAPTVPRRDSVPPVPSARKMIPAIDTGDFPKPGPNTPALSLDMGDSLRPDHSFVPGELNTESVTDEPALSFDSLAVPDDEQGEPTGSFGATPPPRMDTAPVPPPKSTKRKTKLLGLYGFLFMVFAGAVVVVAFKFVDGGEAPAATPDAGVALAAPPPQAPPPIDTARADAAKPPPAEPPAKAPPPEVVETPPPKEVPPKKAPPKKAPPKKAPPKKAPPKKAPLDTPDLDAALAKLDKPPPPVKSKNRELEVACDEGDGQACLDLARDLLDKKNAVDDAKTTFERACNFGKSAGCLEAGQLFAKSDPDRAIKLYERACKQKLAAGCHAAAKLLYDSDPTRAVELDKKACALGRKSSCAEATKPPAPPPSALDEKMDDDDEKTSTSTS